MKLSADTPLGRILRSPGAEEVLRRHLPEVMSQEHLDMVKGFSLNALARFAGGSWDEGFVDFTGPAAPTSNDSPILNRRIRPIK